MSQSSSDSGKERNNIMENTQNTCIMNLVREDVQNTSIKAAAFGPCTRRFPATLLLKLRSKGRGGKNKQIGNMLPTMKVLPVEADEIWTIHAVPWVFWFGTSSSSNNAALRFLRTLRLRFQPQPLPRAQLQDIAIFLIVIIHEIDQL